MNYKSHVEMMAKDKRCPFCEEKKIFTIDENEYAFVLPARAPYHQDHILVCPKRHIDFLEELSPQETQDIHALFTKRAMILHKKHWETVSFLRQWTNRWPTGKTISHMHWHIIPHFQILYGWDQASSDNRVLYNDDEMNTVINQLKELY